VKVQTQSVVILLVIAAVVILFGGLVAQTTLAKKAVRITFPLENMSIPTGSENVVIAGRSIDNATSDCNLAVKLNDGSYENATAAGRGGDTDYSKWTFKANPQSVKEGDNKITAKITCIQTSGVKLNARDTTHAIGTASGGNTSGGSVAGT
jgi:hypothetical protein